MAGVSKAELRLASCQGKKSFGSPDVARRANRLDDGNVIAGAKWITDALFCRKKNGEGITEDDNPDQVRLLGVRHEIDPRWKGREELVVIVASV